PVGMTSTLLRSSSIRPMTPSQKVFLISSIVSCRESSTAFLADNKSPEDMGGPRNASPCCDYRPVPFPASVKASGTLARCAATLFYLAYQTRLVAVNFNSRSQLSGPDLVNVIPVV